VRQNDAILLLGLINEFIEDAELADLEGTSLTLTLLLGVGVTSYKFTTFRSFGCYLLLRTR
jgi:hypothetical protein